MEKTDRREFLERGVAVAAATVAVTATAGEAAATAGDSTGWRFSNRVHIYAKPAVKEKLTWFFSTVLGCGAPMSLNAAGVAEPILAWRFPGGGSISIDFTEEALDEVQAGRGAWLEIWADDPAAMKAAILDARLPQVHYPATNTFYFAAPGGQVFGVVSARQPSAGELRQKP